MESSLSLMEDLDKYFGVLFGLNDTSKSISFFLSLSLFKSAVLLSTVMKYNSITERSHFVDLKQRLLGYVLQENAIILFQSTSKFVTWHFFIFICEIYLKIVSK